MTSKPATDSIMLELQQQCQAILTLRTRRAFKPVSYRSQALPLQPQVSLHCLWRPLLSSSSRPRLALTCLGMVSASLMMAGLQVSTRPTSWNVTLQPAPPPLQPQPRRPTHRPQPPPQLRLRLPLRPAPPQVRLSHSHHQLLHHFQRHRQARPQQHPQLGLVSPPRRHPAPQHRPPLAQQSTR